MDQCFQFENISVYDHGLDVRECYHELRSHLIDGTPLSRDWTLPAWIRHPKIITGLIDADDRIVHLYQVYHDCGKPICKTVDERGRQHFRDHARISKKLWTDTVGPGAVADLIGMDMDVHTAKTDAAIQEIASKPQAITMLLTALCEIHSNSRMFGGISSKGFITKLWQIEHVGRMIISENA